MDKREKLERFNRLAEGTLQDTLGIRVTGIDGEAVLGEMDVNERTVQPFGYLHGGASAAFAETLGSYGANLNVDFPRDRCLGVGLSCNHLQGVMKGARVFGRAEPLRIGRTIQVWQVEVRNGADELVCDARLTTITVRGRDGE